MQRNAKAAQKSTLPRRPGPVCAEGGVEREQKLFARQRMDRRGDPHCTARRALPSEPGRVKGGGQRAEGGGQRQEGGGRRAEGRKWERGEGRAQGRGKGGGGPGVRDAPRSLEREANQVPELGVKRRVLRRPACQPRVSRA
jgi:hypothetical protein